MRRSSVSAIGLTLLLTALLTGCGSSHGGSSPTPRIDLSALDFGPYDASPRDMGKPKNALQAADIEAERLGNVVPLAMDIDPALVYGGNSNAVVFTDPKNSMLPNFCNLDNFAAVAPGLVGGFVSYGRSSQANAGLELVDAVMLFPDEQSAAGAATALEHLDFTSKPGNHPVPIPKYPAAHAHWEPGTQAIDDWYASGKMLVFTSVYDHARIWFHHADLPELVGKVTKSLDTVVPAIAKFTPHPVDQLTYQPIDDSGMLGRTMVRPKASTDDWLNPPAVYDAHAALNWSTDPLSTQQWLVADGVDKYAQYGNDLYRTRDEGTALDARDQLGDPEKHFKSAAPPRGLPIAKCRQYHGPQTQAIHYYCAVAHGRYASQSWGDQLLDAQQRISAQYAILVKAKS
ncbi:hypothetical protein ABIA39_003701 [Nocardia sp. GAS34]|uniref:DUF7373 family lipoprotein n=1 Tax=unclassified Nocardia TaxID=2637762 RepID=UPI003D21A0BD